MTHSLVCTEVAGTGYGDFEGVVLRDDGDLGFLVKYANDSDMEHIDAGELLDLIHR